MKWNYQIETATTDPAKIDGHVYGTFADAVGQVRRAIEAEGWSLNTVAVVVRITPVQRREVEHRASRR